MKTLSQYTEKAISDVYDSCGGFFAFGSEQFDRQKEEGKIYVSMGAGLYCPKENAQKLYDGIEQAHRNGIIQDVAENGAEKIIQREYFNYEMHISHDPINFLDEIKQYEKIYPKIFTKDLIKYVCNCCYKIAIDNDLV